jgi:hypothetical protein
MKKLLLSLSMIVLVGACTLNGMDYLSKLVSDSTPTEQTPVPPRMDLGETGKEPMGILPGETPEVAVPANATPEEKTEISKIITSAKAILATITATVPDIKALVASMKTQGFFASIGSAAKLATKLAPIATSAYAIVSNAQALAKADPSVKGKVLNAVTQLLQSPEFKQAESSLREAVKGVTGAETAVNMALDQVDKLPEKIKAYLQK